MNEPKFSSGERAYVVSTANGTKDLCTVVESWYNNSTIEGIDMEGKLIRRDKGWCYKIRVDGFGEMVYNCLETQLRKIPPEETGSFEEIEEIIGWVPSNETAPPEICTEKELVH